MKFLAQEEVQRIGEAIGLKGKFMVDWGTDHILEKLCPKPQTETVPIVRWLYIPTATYHVTLPTEAINPELWVELTGTYHKPVKPKVKKRLDLGELKFDSDKNIVAGAAFYEMSNRPDWLAGKTGRFIFEYEEAAE